MMSREGGRKGGREGGKEGQRSGRSHREEEISKVNQARLAKLA